MSGPFAAQAVHQAAADAAIWLNAYEPMEVGEHGYGYSAVRRGYDGAPDSHCPLGIGRTVFQAIADLIEQEWEDA